MLKMNQFPRLLENKTRVVFKSVNCGELLIVLKQLSDTEKS